MPILISVVTAAYYRNPSHLVAGLISALIVAVLGTYIAVLTSKF